MPPNKASPYLESVLSGVTRSPKLENWKGKFFMRSEMDIMVDVNKIALCPYEGAVMNYFSFECEECNFITIHPKLKVSSFFFNTHQTL